MNDPVRNFTLREAAAYALAMLELDGEDPFTYREACGELEDRDVRIDTEQLSALDWQAEICSPASATGRDAFAIVGRGEDEQDAVLNALKNLFEDDALVLDTCPRCDKKAEPEDGAYSCRSCGFRSDAN